jgi:predicted DCC family thiol-disulfide oxidoreductase YuxK
VLESPLARPGFLRDLLLDAPDGLHRALTHGALGLELAFAPLALFRRLRPVLWLAMLLMHLGLIVLIDFADLSLGMVMLHLFTFDPAWVRAEEAKGQERVFYDGSCGLCHRFVRFVLSEDARAVFRFAPLQGDAFTEAVPEDRRAGLPDSVVVLTAEGVLLVRSDAALHVLRRLGGLWRVLAIVGGVVPRVMRDRVYDGVAAVRKKLFAPPPDACPILPAPLRARFDH